MRVIKPTSEDQSIEAGSYRIFLGGSIDNGMAEEWQIRVEQMLSHLPVTIFNPRRTNWIPDLKQDISEPEFSYQVNWEIDNIDHSDIVFFYFSPGGPAPITLMELGYVLGAGPRPKLFVICPEGYWRRGNVQIMCARKNVDVYDTIDEAVVDMLSYLGGGI